MKIFDIIKYEGDNDVFVWKHPAEDFNTASQLIVHESQEAIFFRDGQALDLFGPGRYTLQTQNLPFLRKLINLPTGGETPFHCEVYFINKTMPLNIKWGTSGQINVLDPKFNILLHAGASGGMGVQIEDARKFLIKFVGTASGFNRDALTDYFREIMSARVKTYLNNIMSRMSFVTVNSHLDEMSKAMHESLSAEMEVFGVKLINFIVSTIKLDERDYGLIQTALAEASAVGIAAMAEKGKMETLGYNWADRELSDIMKTYAGNEGSQNNVGGMMAQMPIAFAFGQMMKDSAFPNGSLPFSNTGQVFGGGNSAPAPASGQAVNENAAFCSECGRGFKSDEKFCAGCGKKREG
ncbi:MAG: SPFH domain-containing protein [Oscillospiraceae bacterium]|jgi:membrane protease subunit (stomatin/prohibitin family)|nr:SPFH domain-containing protein [Oscillospiraceae bacterium]